MRFYGGSNFQAMFGLPVHAYKQEIEIPGVSCAYYISAPSRSPFPFLRNLLIMLPCVLSMPLCPLGLLLALMASFPTCSIQESRRLGLEKKGFIPTNEVSRWRLESEGEVPCPRDDKVVVLAS